MDYDWLIIGSGFGSRAFGVSGLESWELREATRISADVAWAVGYGINSMGEWEVEGRHPAAPTRA